MAVELLDNEKINSEDNPYLIYSYDDLREITDNSNNYSGNYSASSDSTNSIYFKLMEDIDFKDKKEDWKTVKLGNVFRATNGNVMGKHIIFDLNNKTIKNVLLKTGQSLFQLNYAKSQIRNGKILNIFGQNANSFITGGTSTGDEYTLRNIILSANNSGCAYNIIEGCRMYNCSMYLYNNRPDLVTNTSHVLVRGDRAGQDSFNNCYFYIDVENYNTDSKPLFGAYSSNSGGAIGCLFEGKIAQSNNGSISKDNLMFPNGYKLKDCAVNIEVNWGAVNFYLLGNAFDHTGIINNTKIHNNGYQLVLEGDKIWDLIAVDDEHWNDAQWLSNHGFYVAQSIEG